LLNLSKRGFNQPFSSKTYIAFCRFFLGLPRPITVGNAVSTSSDYPLQPCLEHVGHYLDANACHASACTAAYKARNIKHNNIVRVLSAAATEAGLEATREPDTHTLLLAEFSKEDCRRIFPKKLNIAYRTAFSNLTVASETFMNPSCTLSSEQKSAVLQHLRDSFPITDRKDTKGLRIDLSLVNPLTFETKWIDVTSVNPVAISYSQQEYTNLLDQQRAESIAESIGYKSPFSNPSPTLVAREAEKREKYSRLLQVANKQTYDGKRRRRPDFAPFAMTTLGALGPDAFILFDWIVLQFKSKCKREPTRSDGLTVKELVQDFRCRLKLNLQFAMAHGMGDIITSAGVKLQVNSDMTPTLVVVVRNVVGRVQSFSTNTIVRHVSEAVYKFVC
jgi:hypothetical protein